MDKIKDIAGFIPDFWFDWFARFIPGSISLTVFLILDVGLQQTIQFGHIFLFILLSYLAGHIIQPLSSFVIKKIEKSIGEKQEEKYSKAKRDKDTKKSLLLKVSKTHAESVGMFSSALLIILFCVLTKEEHSTNQIIFLFIFPIYLTAGAIERIFARKRKINDLK